MRQQLSWPLCTEHCGWHVCAAGPHPGVAPPTCSLASRRLLTSPAGSSQRLALETNHRLLCRLLVVPVASMSIPLPGEHSRLETSSMIPPEDLRPRGSTSPPAPGEPHQARGPMFHQVLLWAEDDALVAEIWFGSLLPKEEMLAE